MFLDINPSPGLYRKWCSLCKKEFWKSKNNIKTRDLTLSISEIEKSSKRFWRGKKRRSIPIYLGKAAVGGKGRRRRGLRDLYRLSSKGTCVSYIARPLLAIEMEGGLGPISLYNNIPAEAYTSKKKENKSFHRYGWLRTSRLCSYPFDFPVNTFSRNDGSIFVALIVDCWEIVQLRKFLQKINMVFNEK